MERQSQIALSYHDYTVAPICALPIELTATTAILGTIHEPLPRRGDDTNAYTLGTIAAHHVVIACLPSGYYGTNTAATVASNLHIRLGDVVVSQKVAQYDLGKTVAGEHFIRTTVAKIRARHALESSQIPKVLAEMIRRYPSMDIFAYPAHLHDCVFEATYDHVDASKDCHECDASRLVVRKRVRGTNDPEIHYGMIASGNQVMKNGKTRDRVAQEPATICFMEAAGLMDSFPCLVIRGICDYSDSHKNDHWQEYAAATAAAYAKELLSVLPVAELEVPPPLVTVSERRGVLLENLKFHRMVSHRTELSPHHQETALEKSTEAMYRSLLFQLLSQVPGLENLLRIAIEQLDQKRLVIFIAALDECDEYQVEEMVEMFEDLGQHAALQERRLLTCFSSRHYPYIDIGRGRRITLELEPGHQADIATYIRARLGIRERQLAIDVRRQLCMKASGIFMWVVFVVGLLNEEYKRGRLFAVQERIETLPSDLSDLFRETVMRDESYTQDLQVCIQWILGAQRPLSLEEYYYAAISALDPGKLQKWEPYETNEEDMSKFLLSSSRGLAEITRTASPIVQFIHESAREFFLTYGLSELWPGTTLQELEADIHNRLRDFCYTYLTFYFTSGFKSIEEISSNLELTLTFPFLQYAATSVLYHANEAAQDTRYPQYDFLQAFPLVNWIQLHNVFVDSKKLTYTPSASLLYIAADSNFAALINTILSHNPTTDIEGERHDYPLFAAVARDNWDAALALSLHGSSPPKDNTAASRNGDQEAVELLLRKGADVDARNNNGWTPLLWAVDKNFLEVVQILLANGADIHAENKDGVSPLGHATQHENDWLTDFLLDGSLARKKASTN
ncbi:hypothetical protein BJY04DRAFT_207002 [Aspergillus karnatakaensis]|uniref:uncharacterized protein n=1 Tax=Aspergillus karnatakaensis TaxID=1810916 RepID=UPI003CCD3050